MLELAFITSLKIVFVWGAMQEGMILHWLRRLIDWMISPLPPKVFLWLRKPMYDCLFCMSSFWGVVFTTYYSWAWTLGYRAFSWQYIELLLTVGGINYIIQWLITDNNGQNTKIQKNKEASTTIENNSRCEPLQADEENICRVGSGSSRSVLY